MKTWIKWVIGVSATLLVLAAATVTAVVIVLKSEKLTPLVEEYAPRFINGELKAKKIEVTFWRTFPRLSIDIDSLTLTSHALTTLDSMQRSELPEWSDTLLTLNRFHGSLNLHKLLKNEIEIYDVILERPSINIVDAGNGIANYNLVAAEESTDSTKVFSSISINSFRLADSGPLRYFSLPDTCCYEAWLTNITVNGAGAPTYTLNTGGSLKAELLDRFNIDKINFAVDGSVGFDFDKGISKVDLDDFRFEVGSLKTVLTGSATYSDSIVVNTLNVKVDGLEYSDIYRAVPTNMLELPEDIKTDAKINLEIALTEPYIVNLGNFAIPSAEIDLEIPQSSIKWRKKGIDIERFLLNTHLYLDGNNLDKSRIELKRLLLDGQAIDIDLRALVTQPITNPRIGGEIKGRVFTDRLPKMLLQTFPGKIQGIIGLNTAFRFKKSQLNPKDFHKIFARGTISLRDFEFDMCHTHADGETDSLYLYTPLALLHFESDKTVESNGVKIDSLLSLNLTSDSIHYFGDDMEVKIIKLEAGLGSKNVCQSSDTTRINPFGGRITANKLSVISEVDSTRFGLREAVIDASLSRFEGADRVPLLRLSTQARRISGAVPDGRITISRPAFTLTAHMNPRHERHRNHLNDSTRIDRRRNHQADVAEKDTLNSGLRELLRRWNVKGSLTARRGRLFTPMFPLNNTFSHVDLQFSTDSIKLNSLKLKAGESDFLIRGKITDIKKSFSRRHKSPLKLEFTMESDTINIDELSRAVFAGAAAERDTSLWSTSVDDTMDVADVINVDTTATAALIVPDNIDAMMDFHATTVIYTGLTFHNFKGELGMWDNAIHLHDLNATSPMGDLDVSAIYSAPSEKDLEFGMGMQLLDFHIERFLQVTPAVAEMLPAMKDLAGVINAEIALTTRLDKEMDFIIPSMEADVKIDGDSLVLLDADTFKSLSKWLMFKNKQHNMIDHMSVQMQVDSSQVLIYPFIFNIDRYKLGVMGTNDLDMNFNYHVSVLKSPVPFKFGINIAGNLDKYKIKLGGAKIKENTTVERVTINSETRINLVNQLENIFRKSAETDTGKVKIQREDKHTTEIKKELSTEGESLTEHELNTLEGDTGTTPQ